MTDIETLKRQLENRQSMFTEQDEQPLRDLAEETGSFSVIRRPDLPTTNARGKMLMQIEVRYND